MNSAARLTLAPLAAAALVAGGASAGYVARGAAPQPAAAAAPAATAAAAPALGVNAVYRRARSAVVEITAASGGASSFPYRGSSSSTAQGSGFVYDGAGHVLTSEHVVEGATQITVRFRNGATSPARVVGSDRSSDVAVLAVARVPQTVQPLAFARSSSLRVGDQVVAIGSPFGLEETVTTGIVSALGREITSPNGFAIEGAIQTDAAINHGNSGGPLLDLNGNVIGLNAQIESDSGGNDGVGFAIASDTVRRVAAALVSSGKVTHAYLGVSVADAAGGAALDAVRAGTPAATAGLRGGDVVTAVSGHRVSSAAALRRAIDARSPGDRVTLTVRRGGATVTVVARLGARPS
jgi:putative serine protease PepD